MSSANNGVVARTHRRRHVSRKIRVAKQGNARAAIGTIEHGAEIYVLTFGQFSLIDALVAVLEQTGPADVDIATWTAAHAHLEQSAQMLAEADITQLRFIVDRSFATRQPEYCRRMRELFGDQCIRTARSHAKFMVIRNETWDIAIRTSMNLNENPRLENIEISADPGMAGFLTALVDEIFSENLAGEFASEIPGLSNIENVEVTGLLDYGPPTSNIMHSVGTATLGKKKR